MKTYEFIIKHHFNEYAKKLEVKTNAMDVKKLQYQNINPKPKKIEFNCKSMFCKLVFATKLNLNEAIILPVE